MTQLDRLLAVVRRTGLPVIIPGDGTEDCVLLPLRVYERLSEEGSALDADPSLGTKTPYESGLGPNGLQPSFLEAFQTGPAVASPDVQPVEQIQTLQDLLESHPPSGPKLALSATLPQAASQEDAFAFGGLDTKILPQPGKNILTMTDLLDEA